MSVTGSQALPIPALDSAVRAALDAQLVELVAGSATWSRLALHERASLMGELHAAVAENASYWVDTACEAKGLTAESPLRGEEWLSGPYALLTALAAYHDTLTALAEGKSPLGNRRLRTAPGGRVAVPVLPQNKYEGILLHGFSAEVWMTPGLTESQVRDGAGLGQREPGASGGVGLVLGAGNVTSIPPLDFLYELLAFNRVSLVKLNPTMATMLPVYTRAFAPLIRRGLLRLANGAGDIGGYLTKHEKIGHVHITGSALTHDVIVWGPGPDGRARKAANEPLLTTPITSELGGVSPIIVVPGTWTARDLRFQAEHIATQRLQNGGYNCIASQIVVLAAVWPQKEAFLTELRRALAAAPERVAWYPGSDERVERAGEVYPDAERLGSRAERLLITAGSAPLEGQDMLSTEYFSPVLGVIELPGTGQAFLDTAVDTVNRDFAGTLGANLVGKPSDIRRLGSGFEAAIERLRYGTIAINSWTAMGYMTAMAPWGAFPGGTLQDVGSGIGVVHNALLLEFTERTVVRGPFRPFPRSVLHGEFALFPKPPWFISSRSGTTTSRRMTEFAKKPGWGGIPAILAAAFRA